MTFTRFNPLDRGDLNQIMNIKVARHGHKSFNPLDRGDLNQIYQQIFIKYSQSKVSIP